MQIAEPTTMLTDYLLAALTIVLAIGILKVGRIEKQVSIRMWVLAFFATAVAALAGGTSHGFAFYLGDTISVVLWKATVYAIGLASFFMLSGTIVASVAPPLGTWLQALAVVKFVIYAVWMANHDEFRYVIYDYAPAMLGVIALQSYAYYSRHEPGARWIVAGILVSFAAAGIQQSGFTLHQHLDQNDLYHVIQMAAIYLFYKGALLLKDKK